MIQAVIFDLDGTVLLNEGDWERAFRKVIENNNFTVGTGTVHEPGAGMRSNWKRYVTDEADIARLSRETREAYWAIVGDPGNLRVREGLEDMVEWVKSRGWLTALATSSNWDVVEQELEALSLHLAFDVTTTGEEVDRPKPDPEIFLWTAQKLGVEPENCVVIEDAIVGITAAVQAGMKTIGMVSDYVSEEEIMDLGAGLAASDLAQAQKWITIDQP